MRLLLFLSTLLLGACSARLDDYLDSRQVLNMRQLFSGNVQAWGQFQDRSGKVVRRFRLDELTLFFRREDATP